MSKFLNISTDNTLGGNSPADDVVSSQKAVKDYIDSHAGASTISGLTDTTITTPTNGQVLTYDNATSKWINAAVPTELPSITGNASKILSVNSGATGVEWITNSGGGGTWGSITGTLSNQTDLQAALDAKQDEISQQTSAPSNPSDGDLWIDTDATPSISINLSDLGDTTITTPTNGQVLTYDNSTSKWINSNIPSVPTPTSADENKLLSVNSSGQYVLVTIVNSENVAY